MIRFPTVRNRLLAVHFLLAILLCALVGLAGWRLFVFPPDVVGAAGLIVIVTGLVFLPAVIYRIFLLLTAYFEISSSGGLTLHFGPRREVIPIDEIEEIRSGSRIPDSIRKMAPGWMEVWQGRVAVEGEEEVDWVATDRGARLLLIVTKRRRLVISPSDPAELARSLTDLSTHGSLEKVEPLSIQPRPILREIFGNPAAIGLLGGGLAGITALGAFLIGIQPSLPADQPFRFDPSGIPTSLGDPLRLLILPLAGGAVWSLNALIGWWVWREEQRPAAFALWTTSLIVTIGLWAASVALLLAK